MQKNYDVLIVGETDRIEILSINTGYNIIFAANFGEAAEHLKRRAFGHVITDAVLPENESGFDIVQMVQDMDVKPSLVVCHHDPICKVGERDWNIPRSLEVYFEELGTFHQDNITNYWSKWTRQLKRCA